MFWWMRQDLVFLVGRTKSGVVFCGVCVLIMILGSLCANGCGCVPVLLVVWHRVSSWVEWRWIEWSWVLALRWRPLWEHSLFDIMWSREFSGGPITELGSPTSEAQAWHRPEHQDPVSHMAQKKSEKERKERRKDGWKEGRMDGRKSY